VTIGLLGSVLVALARTLPAASTSSIIEFNPGDVLSTSNQTSVPLSALKL